MDVRRKKKKKNDAKKPFRKKGSDINTSETNVTGA